MLSANDVSIMSGLKNLGFYLWDFFHFVSGEGTWRLYGYEETFVSAALAVLSVPAQKLIWAQLEQRLFVERVSDGRIAVIRFYEIDERLRVAPPECDDSIIEVKIAVDGKSQIIHVTFFKGVLFSIELEKPRKFYKSRKVSVVDVKLGIEAQSYTKDIDRLEHEVKDGEDEL